VLGEACLLFESIVLICLYKLYYSASESSRLLFLQIIYTYIYIDRCDGNAVVVGFNTVY
jgi:hypothetical protein